MYSLVVKTLLGLLGVTAVVLNCLLVIAFARNRSLRRGLNVFVLHLCVANLFVGLNDLFQVVIYDLYAADKGKGHYRKLFKFGLAFLVASYLSSLLHVVGLTISRLLVILYPLHVDRFLRETRFRAILTANWLVSFAIMVATLALSLHSPYLPQFYGYVITISLSLSFVVMTVAHAIMFKIVLLHIRCIKKTQSSIRFSWQQKGAGHDFAGASERGSSSAYKHRIKASISCQNNCFEDVHTSTESIDAPKRFCRNRGCHKEQTHCIQERSDGSVPGNAVVNDEEPATRNTADGEKPCCCSAFARNRHGQCVEKNPVPVSSFGRSWTICATSKTNSDSNVFKVGSLESIQERGDESLFNRPNSTSERDGALSQYSRGCANPDRSCAYICRNDESDDHHESKNSNHYQGLTWLASRNLQKATESRGSRQDDCKASKERHFFSRARKVKAELHSQEGRAFFYSLGISLSFLLTWFLTAMGALGLLIKSRSLASPTLSDVADIAVAAGCVLSTVTHVFSNRDLRKELRNNLSRAMSRIRFRSSF